VTSVDPSLPDTEPSSVHAAAGGTTYASAGVDVEAGERAVALMREAVARAQRPEVVGGLGGFAGLFDASALRAYRRPLLATSTDGVGTKVAVAQRMGVHHTIGIDLVGMVVDDLVVCGAEPLFMTDYIAIGKVVPERVAAIVAGIAEGCRQAGCALVGGETAEHPGLLAPDEYDVAGAGTGVVEADELLGPDRVRPGDVAIALRSSGMHANGYSLARHVLLTRAGLALDLYVAELGRTLGEELLEPTRIYAQDCLSLIRAADVDLHALSHVTGGGLAANLARVLPPDVHVVVDRSTWTPHPVFGLVGRLGSVPDAELERTYNQGVGMVALLAPSSADRALAMLKDRGVDAWVCGEARPRRDGESGDAEPKGGAGGAVSLVGTYG
jgi:phosphoribosylformylglycinamidine cyclo-ligase